MTICKNVYQLYGLPNSIISNPKRNLDSIFREFCSKVGYNAQMSTTNYPIWIANKAGESSSRRYAISIRKQKIGYLGILFAPFRGCLQQC